FDRLAVAGDGGREILDVAAGAPLVAVAEDHSTMEDVDGEGLFDVFGRRVHVGELDGRSDGGDRSPHLVFGGVGGDVVADPHGELRFSDGVGPAGDVDGRAVV